MGVEKEREDFGMGVADDGNVHTARMAGRLISTFGRFHKPQMTDYRGLYGDFEKRVKFGFPAQCAANRIEKPAESATIPAWP